MKEPADAGIQGLGRRHEVAGRAVFETLALEETMGTRQIEDTMAIGESLHDIEDDLDHAEMCAKLRAGTVDIDVPRRIEDEPLVHPLGNVCHQLTIIVDALRRGPQRESVHCTVKALQHAQAICRQSILLDQTDPSRIEQDLVRAKDLLEKASK